MSDSDDEQLRDLLLLPDVELQDSSEDDFNSVISGDTTRLEPLLNIAPGGETG